MTAAERLMQLSALNGVSAATHWLAMPGATGPNAGSLLVARSSLITGAAAAHLLDEGNITQGGNPWLWVRRRRR